MRRGERQEFTTDEIGERIQDNGWAITFTEKMEPPLASRDGWISGAISRKSRNVATDPTWYHRIQPVDCRCRYTLQNHLVLMLLSEQGRLLNFAT